MSASEVSVQFSIQSILLSLLQLRLQSMMVYLQGVVLMIVVATICLATQRISRPDVDVKKANYNVPTNRVMLLQPEEIQKTVRVILMIYWVFNFMQCCDNHWSLCCRDFPWESNAIDGSGHSCDNYSRPLVR